MATLDDTPPAPDAAVVFSGPDGRRRSLTLHAGLRRVTIGRGPGNDIPLGWDTDASRLHAELERLGADWTLVDDGVSRIGTLLNGERIAGRQRLRDGDRVQVGKTVLTISIPKPHGKGSRGAAARAKSAGPELSPTQRRVLEALCRPYKESEFATPATNQQIAEELFISSDAVKAHLRALFFAFGIEELPQARRRSALATRAIQLAVVR